VARRYVSPEPVAIVYTSLGEKDQAFAWMEKANEAKSGWLATSLMTFPDYDPLRSDPRFPALLMKMGLARRAVGSRSGSRAYPGTPRPIVTPPLPIPICACSRSAELKHFNECSERPV
jgi:hypothetical protein